MELLGIDNIHLTKPDRRHPLKKKEKKSTVHPELKSEVQITNEVFKLNKKNK